MGHGQKYGRLLGKITHVRLNSISADYILKLINPSMEQKSIYKTFLYTIIYLN